MISLRFRAMRWCCLLMVQLVVFLTLPACSRNSDAPPPKEAGFAKLSGTITYDGQPVKYGLVLLYPLMKGEEVKGEAPKMTTIAVASVPIKLDGGYEFPMAPVGLVKVCIATNPDVPRHLLIPKREKEWPIKDKRDKLPPDFGLGKDKFGPDKFGPDKGKPDFDPIAKTKNFNPETDKMDAEEKAVLRQIHKLYGDPARSPLLLPIHPGEQKRDFELNPELKR